MSTTVPDEPRNVVYGLHRKDQPGLVRYIGLTTQGLKTRLAQHLSDGVTRAHLPVHRWISKHGRENITATPLAFAETAEELTQIEMRLIAEYRQNGTDLLNLTDGGEGPNGYVYTDEHREKQRQARLGYEHTEETRRRMSVSAISVWADADARRERVRQERGPALRAGQKDALAALALKYEDPEWVAEVSRKRNETLFSRPESLRTIALVHAKLTEAEVLEIRRRSDAGEGRSALGREFGVSPSTTSAIARRRTWTYLAEETPPFSPLPLR